MNHRDRFENKDSKNKMLKPALMFLALLLSFLAGHGTNKDHMQQIGQSISDIMLQIRVAAFDTCNHEHPTLMIMDNNTPSNMKVNDQRECAYSAFKQYCEGRGLSAYEISEMAYAELEANDCPPDILEQMGKIPGFGKGHKETLLAIKKYADGLLKDIGIPIDFDNPPEKWTCYTEDFFDLSRTLNQGNKAKINQILSQDQNPKGPAILFYDDSNDSLNAIKSFQKNRQTYRKDYQRRKRDR
jgi:hypothetical protein